MKEKVEFIELENYAKFEKEESPDSNAGHFLLFSMQDVNGIELSLKSFRKHINKESNACCASLLWTGPEGSNVPVTVHHASHIGFVIHPEAVDVPQADTLAMNSGGRIKKEKEKNGAVTWYELEGCERKELPALKTNHACKKGYIRTLGSTGSSHTQFVTNLAKFEKKDGQAVYHPKGDVKVFAEHIRRKYFNNKHREDEHPELMKKNEALVFQKGNKNPIIGLFATEQIDFNDKNNLKKLLEKNSSLSLYLYSKNESEHIVRVLTNKDAIAGLNDSKNTFKTLFEKALPFQGYDDDLFKTQSYEEEPTEDIFEEIKELPHKKSADNKKTASSRLSDYINERRKADCNYSPGFFTNKFIFGFQRKNQRANVALAEELQEKLQSNQLTLSDLKSKGLKALRKDLPSKYRIVRGRSSLDKIIDDLKEELSPEKKSSSCFF